MVDRIAPDFDALMRSRVRAYADEAMPTFDASAVTREAIARSRRLVPIGSRLRSVRSRTVILLAAALAVALLAAVIVAGTRRPAIGDSFSSPGPIVWSPDGSMLAFFIDVGGVNPGAAVGTRSSHHELWVVSADGSGRRLVARLPSGGPMPSVMWSPDGRRLAFEQRHAGSPSVETGHDIAVVSLDGSPPRVLVGSDDEELIVGWSPDGDRLLFNRWDSSGSDIFVVSVDSDAIQQLTTSHAASADAWSPDGSRILFEDGVINGTQTTDSGTWVMHADGSAKTRLGACCAIGWSPDSARVYFEAESGPLVSAAADGTDVRQLIDNHAPYGWALSPDGSRYATATDAGIDVGTVGQGPTHVTTSATDTDPHWSPDGRWIAFWSTRPDGTGLRVVPADGGQPQLVGADSIGGFDPWQPDPAGTQRLAFARDRGILAVGLDGSDQRELMPRTLIAGEPRGATAADASFQDRMVIGPDGPDRDIYRVSVGSKLAFTFENRTDVPMTVVLEGFGISTGDCLPRGSRGMVLASYKERATTPLAAPATPPDNCLVPPHGSISIDKYESLSGPATVIVMPSGGDYWAGYPVIFDLVGNSQ